VNYSPRQLLAYYNRLAPRERLLVTVAAVATAFIVLYSFVWDPLQTNRVQVLRRIAAKERDLAEIQQLRQTYLTLMRRLEANRGAISEGDPNFNLFAYVQGAITQAVSREHVVSLNPATKSVNPEYQEQQVEVKLQQVSLPQIVDMLHRIEKGEHPLRFSRLQLKKRRNDIYNFDVTATVSLLTPVNKSQPKSDKPAGS
jgi:type II secretory pathway component PulM